MTVLSRCLPQSECQRMSACRCWTPQSRHSGYGQFAPKRSRRTSAGLQANVSPSRLEAATEANTLRVTVIVLR